MGHRRAEALGAAGDDKVLAAERGRKIGVVHWGSPGIFVVLLARLDAGQN